MSTNTITTQKVNFKVFRFNADEDYLPYYDDYKMEVTSEEVVLDILDRIKWDHDGSFSYRRSCRHGICGTCAIKVNGRSTLACKESMNTMLEYFGNELTIEPLSIKRAVKDMIIDKGDFWEKHDAIHPYLISDVEEHPEHEHLVTPEEAEELNEAVERLKDCHYILIDTAGGSQYDIDKIELINQYQQNLPEIPIEKMLVLPSNVKATDLQEIYNNYSTLLINNLIFTKLDETISYGNLISFAHKTKKSICYLSVGQNVPDDLIEASSNYLIDCFMNKQIPKR